MTIINSEKEAHSTHRSEPDWKRGAAAVGEPLANVNGPAYPGTPDSRPRQLREVQQSGR